jgi:hypothetical protein
MGGNQGLDLLLHAPMPSSSIPKNLIKIHQTLATAANVPAAAPIIGSSKSISNPLKKPAKGSTPNIVGTSVVAPEVDPTQTSHAGPTWMPVEQYATLMKVCSFSLNNMQNAYKYFQCIILGFLNLLQYAMETQSRGLLSAQEEMIGDESSEWRSWYFGQSGSVLPPCSASSCSTYEKLVIVQM